MMRHRFIGFLLLVSLSSAPPASAALKGISIAPPEPGSCDSISITVAGEIPNPCYEIVGATIRGPEQLPCARPIPCPSRFVVEITVREPDPARTCPAVVAPYTRSFTVGRLPAGEYLVAARERIIPFSGDSTVSESFVNAVFTVRPDPTCPPAPGCYLLDFRPDHPILPPTFCTAVARPGGTACLGVSLMTTEPVGGLQSTIEVSGSDGTSADPFIHAVSVEPVGRAAGFQVGWTVEGAKTKIILYTASGASIPPGAGPVLRICYSIATETPPQMFRILDTATIVADASGEAIPPCPTITLDLQSGIICVSSAGCDVNGDGFSDVLDIIRLVRCALAARNDSTEACPDSIAARADCNGDGSVDIRDVICCVRKIVLGLGSGEGLIPPPPSGAGQGNAVGFEGSVRWINAVDGVAVVRIDAAEGWGGTQFRLDAQGVPVRIRGLKLSVADATALEWA
ncbi:MAG TPA: dockerin type I repeat-containing protein, partial [Candidatus Limnocylindrales bacterium]|nr:dockerin type I repeat-containing protein [Candidatus Limnocylindrales bacterium]